MSNAKDKIFDNPYEKVFDDAKRRLESTPNHEVLKKLELPQSQDLPPIPFPYGREGKTRYNFNAPLRTREFNSY